MSSRADRDAGVRIRFHGTGAGHPSGTRFGSGATLEIDGSPLLLVDAGDSIPRGLIRDGVDPNSIGDLILSHLHPDHWSGIPGLVMAWDICDRSEPATIWLPPGARSFIESVLTNSWLQARPRKYELTLSEYQTDQRFSCSRFDVLPHRTSHLDRYASKVDEQSLSYPSHSFRVEVADLTIIFTQDLGSENDISAILDGCTHLVAESSHVDMDSLIEMAADAGVERVFLTHIPPSADEELQRRYSSEGSNESPEVIVAYDGMNATIRP